MMDESDNVGARREIYRIRSPWPAAHMHVVSTYIHAHAIVAKHDQHTARNARAVTSFGCARLSLRRIMVASRIGVAV